MRRDKLNYYLDIAETVLARGTCLRRNLSDHCQELIRSSPPGMWERPGARKTAVTWATAPGKAADPPGRAV